MEITSDIKNKGKSIETQDLVEGKETWVFIDVKCNIYRKISYQWNNMLQYFFPEDYQMLLQHDPCKYLRKDIYKNI